LPTFVGCVASAVVTAVAAVVTVVAAIAYLIIGQKCSNLIF
jgi:hypothetical protein